MQQTPVSPLNDAPALCRLSAAELAAGYRARAFSPVEVTEAALARAEAINATFNAFTFLDPEGARAAARASEARWLKNAALSPIDGVPTTLKDIVWVKGWSVRYGSHTTPAAPFAADAPSVALLRSRGAVFIGQTTTPEFGWKAVTDSRLSGITRNPRNPAKTAGGSSGGAAVAAATGAGVFHLGTDGGGSIRVPASFSGITGLKPTFGRVPAYPPSAFGTVAHIGPMAARAADTAAMFAAMIGRDLTDWAQGPGDLGPAALRSSVLRAARIGYWTTPPCGTLDGDVARLVDAAVARLAGLGATVTPIDLPGSDHLAIFNTLWFAGAATRLAAVPDADRDGIDPGFREIAAIGAGFSAVELNRAQIRRGEFGAAMDQLLGDYDFVVSPGTAIPAFEAGREWPAGATYSRWTEWAGFNFPINLSQQPAMVVPCGLTPDHLPASLQIIGARGADGAVLSAGIEIEAALADIWSGTRDRAVATGSP